MAAQKLLVVIYDGINNSVFASQVLEPILRKLRANSELRVTLVSFESKQISSAQLQKITAQSDRLQVYIARRLPFFGVASLYYALWQLRRVLAKAQNKQTGGFSHSCARPELVEGYARIIARGPLAGWLVLKAFEKKNTAAPNVVVQARGLCAQEFRYVCQHEPPTGLKKYLASSVQHGLQAVEQAVYGYRGPLWAAQKFSLESVSTALRDYLVSQFGADEGIITIACDDLPLPLTEAQWRQGRCELRGKLGITHDAVVYVYSGSFKAWQCAQETVAEAALLLEKDKTAHCMLLSQDKEQFIAAATAAGIDQRRLHIMAVSPSALVNYLAAADYGFLLREPDIINWVSRPTKALEYQAARLKVVHNGTVGMLVDQDAQTMAQMSKKS